MATEPTPASPEREAAPVEPGAEGPGAPAARRSIDHDGETWLVEIAGRGVAGTGRFADPGIQLVRFTRTSNQADPVLEVVTRLRDLDLALDEEIVELLRSARPPAEPRLSDPGTDFDGPSADEADALPEEQY